MGVKKPSANDYAEFVTHNDDDLRVYISCHHKDTGCPETEFESAIREAMKQEKTPSKGALRQSINLPSTT